MSRIYYLFTIPVLLTVLFTSHRQVAQRAARYYLYLCTVTVLFNAVGSTVEGCLRHVPISPPSLVLFTMSTLSGCSSARVIQYLFTTSVLFN